MHLNQKKNENFFFSELNFIVYHSEDLSLFGEFVNFKKYLFSMVRDNIFKEIKRKRKAG